MPWTKKKLIQSFLIKLGLDEIIGLADLEKGVYVSVAVFVLFILRDEAEGKACEKHSELPS